MNSVVRIHIHMILHIHIYSTTIHNEPHNHTDTITAWQWEAISGGVGGDNDTPVPGADDHYHLATMAFGFPTSWNSPNNAKHSHTATILSTNNDPITGESAVKYRIVLFCQKD